ncbi:MAG TPA: transglycosylase SLT domain-containing protein [Gemmatimonadales bacterium]|nr:transglycosylase SLT domain-containing protein [Gemmatimonadales bacterium]
MAAFGDSLVPPVVEPLPSQQIGAADAEVLEDLAVGSPDDVLVPAFDASGVRWDIDVRTYAEHPRVQYYLRYFQGPARERMAVFLERGSHFEPMIRRRFEAEGLPGDLGYLALIESGYSSEAVSRSRAVGMWQFMRGTGRGYGLRVDTWVDERRDPVKATDAAARHLRDLRERFGSLYLAAAAYNAGAGKVSRSLGKLQWTEPAVDTAAAADEESADTLADEAADSAAESLADAADSADSGETAEPADELPGVTSDAAFFRLAASDLLAAETRDYVPKLIAAALIAKQPARYGFTPAAGAPFGYDSLLVSDATGLDVVARLAGTSLSDIRALNPQYLRLATPPRTSSVVRVPVGTGEDVTRAYAAMPASQRVHFLTHVVRKRERLTTIAARYRLSTADLRSANPKLKGTTRPAAGTRLVIPTVAIPSALAMQAAGAQPHHAASRTHKVRRGETLTAIARRYRVSLPALCRANAIHQDNTLRAGMRLRIPG